MSELHNQEGGDHYKKLGDYQPWIVLSKWMTPEELKGAMKKDVISYLCRESDKNGREDIKKAYHTLGIYLELTEELNNEITADKIYCSECDKITDHIVTSKSYMCETCGNTGKLNGST